MKTKIALAVASAFVCSSAFATLPITKVENSGLVVTPADKSVSASGLTIKKVSAPSSKFNFEPDLAPGTYNYLVRLVDQPVTTYTGKVPGLAATNPQVTKTKNAQGRVKLDVSHPDVQKYESYLKSRQADFLTQANAILATSLDVKASFTKALNAVAVHVTQEQAAKLSTMPGVAFVEREQLYTMDTDTGPTLIGAPHVWDGMATGVGAMGEGVIIGVIDSGVNTDHASFADIGGDGYDHTNPWGEGVYGGDCAGDYPELCNDKLIGVYSYPIITDVYQDTAVFGDNPPAPNGEDYGGHGSHTASTAGGNILMDVPIVGGDFGKEESSGIESGAEFGQISGVAPHANIISYQICWPGNPGDTYTACPFIAIISAIEDAIEDQVDVINYSISGGGNPWQSSTELSFLSAHAAGVFIATSAGNSGPNAQTTPKHAPWYTAVGAATHGRTVDFDKEIGEFSGGDTTLDALSGSAATPGFTGEIVYAGDFVNPNDPEGDPAQCLEPFPAGTFEADQIVVCDRGAIARVAKAQNAAAGGAGGFVLANIDGGADSVASDFYVVPGIHINAEQGNLLRTWLDSGTGHMATITDSEGEITVDPESADITASFSSRGPSYSTPDIMTPSVTAPGVSIYAAYADQNFGHDVTGPAPADFEFLQGTSMSSPHVAGAAALLKSAYPDWSVDNIRSALMMTATPDVMKEDGVTPADFFDMGAGRIRVDMAAKTGLVMDESSENYELANPAIGGSPKSLNIPSMSDSRCVDSCSWTRTFTATTDADWSASLELPEGVTGTVSPATFSITEGASQSVTVTVDVSEGSAGWNMGMLMLESDGLPSNHLPILAMPSNDNLPSAFVSFAGRDKDAQTFLGFKSKEMTAPMTKVYAPQVLGSIESAIEEGDYDLWGIAFDDDLAYFGMEIVEAESPDFDIVLFDENFNIVAQAQTFDTFEKLSVVGLPAGTYYLFIYNYLGSSEGAEDRYVLDVSVAETTEDFEAMDVMSSIIMGEETFDIKVNWDRDFAMYGDFSGVLTVYDEEADVIKYMAMDIMRGEDDLDLSAIDIPAEVPGGITAPIVMSLAPNLTANERNYMLMAELPEGHEVANISHDGVLDGNTITWNIRLLPAGQTEMVSPDAFEPTMVSFDLTARKAGMAQTMTISSNAGEDTETVSQSFTFDVLQVQPVAVASTSTPLVKSKKPVMISGSASYDANNDPLTYRWVQIAGPAVEFDPTAAELSFDAPKVPKKLELVMTFQLVVNDGTENSEPVLTQVVVKGRGSSGSMGWLILLTLPLALLRRMKK